MAIVAMESMGQSPWAKIGDELTLVSSRSQQDQRFTQAQTRLNKQQTLLTHASPTLHFPKLPHVYTTPLLHVCKSPHPSSEELGRTAKTRRPPMTSSSTGSPVDQLPNGSK